MGRIPTIFLFPRIVPAMQNGMSVQAAVTPQEPVVLFLARGPGKGAAGSWGCGAGGSGGNTGQERAGKGDPP